MAEKKHIRGRNLTEEERENNPYVSFRMPLDLKERVSAAAEKNGVTQSAQMLDCVKDGLSFEKLLNRVSKCLSETHSTEDDIFASEGEAYEPSLRECTTFISMAVLNAMRHQYRDAGMEIPSAM